MIINNSEISKTSNCYIIAEISANHNQSIERAFTIIKAAKECGANAVKLQTYTANTITIESNRAEFKIHGTLWDGKTLYELYQSAYTPWEWHAELKHFANKQGLDLFSTPFDPTAVDFLESIDVPAYKIASFETNDIPLLKKIGATQKPVIMSTGMATLCEIDEALTALRTSGCTDIALLKCTSSYPAPFNEANLLTIPHMAHTFNTLVGVSDHSMGIEIPIGSVALGAKIIEKHLTLSRQDGGPDSGFSLEPHEFKSMVNSVRIIEQALGSASYELTPSQIESTKFKRSLYVVKDIKKGELLTNDNIRSIRPAFGLHTRHYDTAIGTRARTDISKGTPLSWNLFE